MPAIHTILAPVDFSEPARKAVAYGLSLALELEAELTLLHVVEYPAPAIYGYPMETRPLTDAEQVDLELRLRELVPAEHRETVKLRVLTDTGLAEDRISALVQTEAVDLVVMGTHGRRRFERWVLGSVTERLLRKLPVPLLTVSRLDDEHRIEVARPVPLRKMMYATDLEKSGQRGLDYALELAERFSADLMILHVVRGWSRTYSTAYTLGDIAGQDKVREEVFELLVNSVPEAARANPKVRVELRDGLPYETILQVAEAEQMDLIVLNTQSRAGLDRALLGSTAERVVRGAHIPVLSVPREAEVKPHLLVGEGSVLL